MVIYLVHSNFSFLQTFVLNVRDYLGVVLIMTFLRNDAFMMVKYLRITYFKIEFVIRMIL